MYNIFYISMLREYQEMEGMNTHEHFKARFISKDKQEYYIEVILKPGIQDPMKMLIK